MAKLNTSRAIEVGRILSPATGEVYVVRSDGSILRFDSLHGGWKKFHKHVKPGLEPEQFIRNRIADGWVRFKGRPPTWDSLRREMEENLSVEATDGCPVEPDGTCPHGFPSWPRAYGLI